MTIRELDNSSLLKYHKAQSYILTLTRRLIDGEDVHDEIITHYSRMCLPVKPSPVERAYIMIIKNRRENMRRLP